MDKKTKMLLGVGLLAAAGYLLWKQSQKPKSFANLMASNLALLEAPNSHCSMGYTLKRPDGTFLCCNPQYFGKTAKDQECTGGKPLTQQAS